MSELITDVGIDLDGVLYPFEGAFRQYCTSVLNMQNLPTPTHWNFYEDWGMDLSTFNFHVHNAALTFNVFSRLAPYAGVQEAWKDLHDLGVRIHVMTARPQPAWEQTARWLYEHQLYSDSLHFNTSKSFLSTFSSGQAAMVDDHIVYYLEAQRSGILPYLLTRPWNTQMADANRVNSFHEFVEKIRNHNRNITNPKEMCLND